VACNTFSTASRSSWVRFGSDMMWTV
jgi:hypothetical protein